MKNIVCVFLALAMLPFAAYAAQVTVSLDNLGEDVNSYKGYLDYGAAGVSVNFTFEDADESKLKGTIYAAGLKPDFTYQVKLEGKPVCKFGVDGDDQANEYIGYKGRWTCSNCTGTALDKNRNDAQYLAYSPYRGDGSECIQGYLVFGFFTTDAEGKAVKYVESDSSFHVLWCSGGTCGLANNDYLVDGLCAPENVNGQIERGSCGTMTLDEGAYDVVIALTEESFHQGAWANVLNNEGLEFTIESTTSTTSSTTTTSTTTTSTTTSTTTTTLPAMVVLDYLNIGDPASEADHDVNGWSGLWTWGGNYGGGDDGTLRTIIPRESTCQSDDKTAYFSMYAEGFATTLYLRHLNGSQNDNYLLYIKEGDSWTQLFKSASIDKVCSSTECWYTDIYPLGLRTATLEFKVVATIDPIPSWCASWGINAFSWARIEGNDCSDGDLCTEDMYDPDTETCVHEAVCCDDDDLCTTEECDPGTGDCVYARVDCSDGDLCTIDSCDPETGCVFEPKTCDDENAETMDSCNPDTGECVHEYPSTTTTTIPDIPATEFGSLAVVLAAILAAPALAYLIGRRD